MLRTAAFGAVLLLLLGPTFTTVAGSVVPHLVLPFHRLNPIPLPDPQTGVRPWCV